MTIPHQLSLRLLACAGALLSLGAGAGAATLTWNTGLWNFNTATGWSNGATSVPWTSNLDTASFQSSAGGTVTVDNGSGQVGAAGIVVGGTASSWTIGGAQLQLGAGGITDTLSAGTLTLSAPIALTASQTWSSTRSTINNNNAGFIESGVISGTGNLTFDGRGLTNPTSTGNTNLRSSFQLGGASANTFSGTTTVTGGAMLKLDYTSGNVSHLDGSSALVLAGGSVLLNGGTSMVQSVGSTLVTAGANTVGGNGGTINQIALGALSHNVGATVDISNSASGIATTTTTNTDSMIGGWATFGGTRWAAAGTTGSATAFVSYGGSTTGASSGWSPTMNVNTTASESGIGSKTINSILFNTASIALGFASGSTLTVTSGGILAAGTGGSLSGGSVTSGMGTGELFVHTANAFGVGSAIVDNGGTAVSLVKDGTSTLTLSGANTYTGATYVNAGTVTVASGGSIASSSRVIVQGGATLDVQAVGHTVGAGKILSGGGTVLGNIVVASGGSIAPAISYLDAASATHFETGTLTLGSSTVASNLTLNDGSALSFRLGTNSDLLTLANGASTLTGSNSAGGITLDFFDAGGVAVGNTYTLMQWASGDTLTNFDTTRFTLNGMAGSLAIANNALTFTVSAVPEPSAVGLGLFGLFSLACVVRRRIPGKAAA